MRTAVLATALAALLPAVLIAPRPAHANPATQVLTPSITEGQREVEFQFGALRPREGGSATGVSLAYAVAPRPWWAIEFGVKGQRESGDRFGYDAWEVENRFALTEPGQYPIDVGLLIEVERPKNRDEGWQLRWRADPALDWGAQGFGETGPWRRWNPRSEQSHQLGPALFGRLKTSPAAALKYDAALLFGTGGTAPRRAQ